MANNKLIIDERQRNLGNFMVGRLLPFKAKRQVGPFVFIDHMGPATIGPNKYSDVDQHPHCGLSTLTYLFDGAVEHRDSTGAVQVIRPGDVGFMTSGKAVTHTERTPKYQRDGATYNLHGYQVWVALPKELEEMAPNFQFVPHEDLPKWQEGPLKMTLVAGEGFGRVAPLKVYSPLFMVVVATEKTEMLEIHGQLKGEIAIVVAKGQVRVDDECVEQGQMLISQSEDICALLLEDDTELVLFGGQPLPEERFLYWNFVASDKEKLKAAATAWENKAFPKVPDDHTYIPLPKSRLKISGTKPK